MSSASGSIQLYPIFFGREQNFPAPNIYSEILLVNFRHEDHCSAVATQLILLDNFKFVFSLF